MDLDFIRVVGDISRKRAVTITHGPVLRAGSRPSKGRDALDVFRDFVSLADTKIVEVLAARDSSHSQSVSEEDFVICLNVILLLYTIYFYLEFDVHNIYAICIIIWVLNCRPRHPRPFITLLYYIISFTLIRLLLHHLRHLIIYTYAYVITSPTSSYHLHLGLRLSLRN